MGLFDNVAYEGQCPICGTLVVDWQTKDGDPGLELVRPETVRDFYGECPECHNWIDAHVTVLEYRVDLTVKPIARERKDG